MTFWHTLDAWVQGVLIGTFVVAPVGYYSVTRFGAVLWQDVKATAYKLWDLVKSKA